MRAIRQATGLRAEYTGPFGGDQAAPLAEVGTDGGGGNVQGKGGRGDWVNSGVNLDKTHRAYWRQEVADFLLARPSSISTTIVERAAAPVEFFAQGIIVGPKPEINQLKVARRTANDHAVPPGHLLVDLAVHGQAHV